MTGARTTSSRLRHRLTLQQEVQAADGAGGYNRSWQNIADLWAEIVPLVGANTSSKGSGKDVPFAGQMQPEISHRILLRYREGVIAGMRLVYENRLFSIRSVADLNEDRDTLQLLVQEGVAT